MESKRLPAQFGLTAKQAFLPVLCACVLGVYRHVCICMSMSASGLGVYLFVFLVERENPMKGIQGSVYICDYAICAFMHACPRV